MSDLDRPTLRCVDVAEALDVSESWVKRSYRQWPHSKVGRFVRFTNGQLAEIIAMHAQRPNQDTPAAPVDDLRPSSRRRMPKRPA